MVASARTLLDTIATATPALYQAFAPITPFMGTDDEPVLIENLYAFPGEINFSDRVLALVPERLAMLRVRGVKWSDLGDPNRALSHPYVRPACGPGGRNHVDSLDPEEFCHDAGCPACFGRTGGTESLFR